MQNFFFFFFILMSYRFSLWTDVRELIIRRIAYKESKSDTGDRAAPIRIAKLHLPFEKLIVNQFRTLLLWLKRLKLNFFKDQFKTLKTF